MDRQIEAAALLALDKAIKKRCWTWALTGGRLVGTDSAGTPKISLLVSSEQIRSRVL